MKISKNYIRFEGDGFSGERKFEQGAEEIRLETTFETKLLPFAMDVDKQSFIIFRIPRKKTVSLYLWVYFAENDAESFRGKKVRLTLINELMLYTKWSGEPMDVSGKYPDETISRAIALLQEWPIEEAVRALIALKEMLEDKGGAERWSEDETAMLKTVKEANREYNGIMYMY